MDCSVTHLEKSAINAVMQFQTVITMECMHCRKIYGFANGKGIWGTSSGTCPNCKAKGLTSMLGVSVADLEAMKDRANATI